MRASACVRVCVRVGMCVRLCARVCQFVRAYAVSDLGGRDRRVYGVRAGRVLDGREGGCAACVCFACGVRVCRYMGICVMGVRCVLCALHTLCAVYMFACCVLRAACRVLRVVR